MRNFKNLEIWNLGMRITRDIYTLLEFLPKEETFGLRSQMSRSTISMPSNIAEGCSRSSNKEFARFLDISIGSAFELETQVLIAIQIGYFKLEESTQVLKQLQRFQKQTSAYRQKVLSN